MITRRTALTTLAAAAASIMVPTLKLNRTVSREAIFASFCDTDYRQYSFESPFQYGGLCYATNARELVRGELSSVAVEGERRLPKVLKAFEFYYKPQSPWRRFELPAVSSSALIRGCYGECPVCDGRRVSYGEHYPTSEDEADKLPCYDPDDNTIYDVSCEFCHGRPTEKLPTAISPLGNNVIFSYSRLKKIAAIPNVEISMLMDSEPNIGYLLFRGDGLEGVAMCIDPSR